MPLSLWRSIEKKSLNLRQEGRWVGINTKIHRPFASLELAQYDVHNVHCGLFRQSLSQRLIFVLYPSRLRQIKCKPVWEKKFATWSACESFILHFLTCCITIVTASTFIVQFDQLRCQNV